MPVLIGFAGFDSNRLTAEGAGQGGWQGCGHIAQVSSGMGEFGLGNCPSIGCGISSHKYVVYRTKVSHISYRSIVLVIPAVLHRMRVGVAEEGTSMPSEAKAVFCWTPARLKPCPSPKPLASWRSPAQPRAAVPTWPQTDERVPLKIRLAFTRSRRSWRSRTRACRPCPARARARTPSRHRRECAGRRRPSC